MQMYLTSENWKEWVAKLDLRTCLPCRMLHGKIFSADDISIPKELHFFCRCVVQKLHALTAGTATRKGRDGADWELFNSGRLPNYYITKKEARKLGWKNWLGNLGRVAPRKMLGGDIYKNDDGKLPDAPGRIWYEADINYSGGYRERERIVYSNDGLIFVSYTHYTTFVEIVGG